MSLVDLRPEESSQTRNWTHVPCTGRWIHFFLFFIFLLFFFNDTHILFIATLLDSISPGKSSDDTIDNQDRVHLINNKPTQVIKYIYSRKRKYSLKSEYEVLDFIYFNIY